MADLYAIIQCTEHLEKAYIRDAVHADEYTPACLKLLAQFKTARSMLGYDSIKDVEGFMRDWKLECPAAAKRLLEIGVPATTEHTTHVANSSSSAKYVAQTVQVRFDS